MVEVGCKPLKMVVVTTNGWLKITTLKQLFVIKMIVLNSLLVIDTISYKLKQLVGISVAYRYCAHRVVTSCCVPGIPDPSRKQPVNSGFRYGSTN